MLNIYQKETVVFYSVLNISRGDVSTFWAWGIFPWRYNCQLIGGLLRMVAGHCIRFRGHHTNQG